MLSGNVSDTALQEIATLASRVGIPGHFIIEVWNSENGLTASNTQIGNQLYFGPAAVMSDAIAAQGIDPTTFGTYNLEQRIPYMGSLLSYQRQSNGNKIPDRPEVLYALNFVPAVVASSGGNPPGSFLLIARNGQFWADNPAFQPDAAPEGITVDTLGTVLTRKRSDPRLQELLSRYTALTGIPYPGQSGQPGVAGQFFTRPPVLAATVAFILGVGYLLYAKLK